MIDTAITSLSGLPSFLAYFVVAILLFLAFAWLYTLFTHHDELALIRAGNHAAALAFGGALAGFALPLSSAIVHSLSLLDCVIWGVVALAVQILTFVVLRMLLPQLPDRITRGETASGIFSAAAAVSVGVINAACMSY